jgi:hypothetical protein
MNLAVAVLITVGAAALAIAAMLLVRRRAPEGGYFADGDRAAGVFGVLATGFAVLIGFVVFLSFESFDTSRSGAEAEARVVAQQFETAQFLPAPGGAKLSGELICYARYVVHEEWAQLESGSLEAELNPWGVQQFQTLKTIEPRTAAEQSAYDHWLDQRSDREVARSDRVHGATGVIPTPLWIVLFLTAGIVFGYMLLFADSGERALVQATMIGGVAVVITSTLLLLWFLDNPYHGGFGTLRPVEMERTLEILEEAVEVTGDVPVPCDEQGAPAGG